MKLLAKIFKKNKQDEYNEEVKPNLMEQIDNNDSIDLMAADPISELVTDEPVIIEKKPEIVESPGIEQQLIEEISVIKEDKTIINNTQINDAFNMPLQNEPDTSIETLDHFEEEGVNLQKTQKFCPDCKTPNDILNKFCVSCGYNFK